MTDSDSETTALLRAELARQQEERERQHAELLARLDADRMTPGRAAAEARGLMTRGFEAEAERREREREGGGAE